MNYCLNDLLPYSDETSLKSLKDKIRVLQLLCFFYDAIQHAMEAFLSKQYHHFDAQVSENLCQIRAYQLVEMIHDKEKNYKESFSILFQVIKKSKIQCELLLKEYNELTNKRPSHYSKSVNQVISLKTFIENHQLDISFSETLYFLAQTYILSHYKLVGDYHISYGIDYEKFCNDLGIASKTFIKKVVHRLQRNISKKSCQFIFKLQQYLHSTPHHCYLLKSLYHQDEIGRHVIACYEATKIILQHVFQNNRWIKITVNRLSEERQDTVEFILKPSKSLHRYVLVSDEEQMIHDSIVSFTGIARYTQSITESKEKYMGRFMQIGFESIILTNMAQHPQYAGILLDNKKYNPYLGLNEHDLPSSYREHLLASEKQFLKHKHLSTFIGCTPEHSHLFLLTHVRCDALIRLSEASVEADKIKVAV